MPYPMRSYPQVVEEKLEHIRLMQVGGLDYTPKNEIQAIHAVMLDEHGVDVISELMESLIGDAGNTGASSIVFCIGGPYGHGIQLKDRADISMKLSSLVLNHEVALVVLMEQLYRARTILKGQKYHHQTSPIFFI